MLAGGIYIKNAISSPCRFYIASHLKAMETSPLLLRVRQAFLGLVAIGMLVVFIALPLMTTDYEARQGTFDAHILSSAAGMGMAARPVVRARVEDELGRVFWIALPPASTTAPDTKLTIDVWCETPAFQSCIARYKGSGSGVS